MKLIEGNKIKINNDDIFAMTSCKRFFFYLRKNRDDFKLSEDVLDEERISKIRNFFTKEAPKDALHNPEKTKELLKSGNSILNPQLTLSNAYFEYCGGSHLILFRNEEYFPVIFHFSRKSQKRHLIIGALTILFLKENGYKAGSKIFFLNDLGLKAHRVSNSFLDDVMNEIVYNFKIEKYPNAKSSKLCGNCLYSENCRNDSVKTNENGFGRLRGVNESLIKKFSEFNIYGMVDLLEHPFEKRILEEIPQSRFLKLQALAVKQNTAFILNSVYENFYPFNSRDLFIDFEADDKAYLFGILKEGIYYPFIKNSDDKMHLTAEAFISYLNNNSDRIFHFSEYEKTEINKLSQISRIKLLSKKFIDVYYILRKTAVLPIKQYSLKAVAAWLGFSWKKKLQGKNSIIYYKNWKKTGNSKFLKNILDYNKDDCTATEIVITWLSEPSKFEKKFSFLSDEEIDEILKSSIK